ncbi:MAG: hypothetical protein CW716_09750, partial [Candidatus Bathyarchaeum sp.]
NGEIKDVIISATSFTVEGKKFLQGTFRDITENKRMEEQLRRERETLELVTENVGAGLAIISKDYKIVWANKFLKNIFGDIEGKTCFLVLNDHNSICPGCGIKKIFETGTDNVVHEQLVPGLKGQRSWIEITANAIRDKNGDIVAVLELSVDVTERKQLDSKLREAEKRYHAIFDKSPVGILIVDSSGNPIEFNEQAHRQLGYSREEFEKLTVSDHEVLETPEETRARVNKILKTGKDEFETKHRTKTGEIRDIKNVVQVIELSGQKFFQVITQDITISKKMEKALQESEERFRQVAEKSGIWVWEIDTNGVYTYASPVVKEVLGYKPEEIVWKKHFYDLFYHEEKEELKTAAFQTFAEKKPFCNFLNRNVHKNRKTVWLSTNGVPVVDANGNLLGYRGSDKDITEQKIAEEALRESEKKYRLLTENTTDVIYIQDMNLNITYASPSVKKLSGYTPDELAKLRPDKFMTPESFERGVVDFKEAIASAIADPDYEIPLKQYQYIRKDGSTLWGELKMKVLRDSNSNLVGIQGNLRDITERKEAEEKLSSIMSELVGINEKLGVIGKLTRHDARNKLAVIANNTYLAKTKLATNPDALQFLGGIDSAIDQMEKIFDFARNYEMLGVEELSYLDVKKNVDEAVILLSGLDTINVVNECSRLKVMADSLLRQLFYNMAENTLKYGEDVTEIKVYYKEEPEQLKLVYEDNGVGIPENEKEKIFQEGYGKGTGYGLYLIKKICEAYCWTIKETGVPGKGAQFTMTIPKTGTNGLPLYRFE